MYTQNPDTLLTALQGQKIFIQDINVLLEGWPRKVNIHLDRLRKAVDVWLEDTMSDSQLLKPLKAADFGLFGATWWPEADWERLKIATYLATWLFCWDDEIDSDDGCLWDDFERSQNVRTRTLSYVRSSLDLPGTLCCEKPSSRIIGGFKIIGEAIRDAYNVEQRRRFMKEITTFVEMSQCEQSMRLDGKIPSIEEFWGYRLGSSAVGVTLAINEFAWGDMHLPRSIMDDENMNALWDQTNVIISTVNDLLSLKKEIARNSIHSVVPLLFARNGDAQNAVDQATNFLAESVHGFEETVRRLPQGQATFDAVGERQVRDFIKGCRYYCSGNLAWSLSTGRYGINCEDMGRGVYVEL